MRIVDVNEAKAQLSRLLDEAVGGESFIIAQHGRPLVKVVPFDAPEVPRRVGFLAGAIQVPADFDRMGAKVIASSMSGDA
jgi:prevent-host-death family protein